MDVINQSNWPSIAQDLALLSIPDSPIDSAQDLYDTYGITETELRNLLTVPEFQGLFKRAYDRLQDEGSKAGANYKFSTLSQSLAEKLYRDAVVSKTMEAKDAVKLLELLFKAAGFMNPPKDTTQVNVQTNVGVAATLPLPFGLENPKLKHLESVNG